MSETVVADPLSLARDLILRPSGLDDRRLDKVFGEVLTHSVDYADLYFQLARQESWSLEDGIVKDGSPQHRAGRRRARASPARRPALPTPMKSCCRHSRRPLDAARAIARQGGRRAVRAWHAQAGTRLYLPDRPGR